MPFHVQHFQQCQIEINIFFSNWLIYKIMEDMQIKYAKEVPILTILQSMGFSTQKYGGNYKAPWRNETKGSLKIYPENNTWCDFGGGKCGGDGIDFYRRIVGCDFQTAVRELCSLGNKPFVEDFKEIRESQNKGGFIIRSVGDITDSTLRQYARMRCIDESILDKYCVQLSYSPQSNPQYTFKAIGFINDSGQYEMSGYNARSGEKFKAISGAPKDITSFFCGNASLLIFEGFFNMLSLFSMPEWMPHSERYDILVLNSVSNVDKAIEALSGVKYNKVGFFVDADSAGLEAMRKLSQAIQADEKRNLFKELYSDKYADFCVKYSIANNGKVADLNDIWIHINTSKP